MAGGLEEHAGLQQLLDAVEVVVDGADGYARPLRDVGDRRTGALVDERHQRLQECPSVPLALRPAGVEVAAVPAATGPAGRGRAPRPVHVPLVPSAAVRATRASAWPHVPHGRDTAARPTRDFGPMTGFPWPGPGHRSRGTVRGG